MRLVLSIGLLLFALPSFAQSDISVTIDGRQYRCSGDGGQGANRCECAVKYNSSERNYYFEVYKLGTKLYTSGVETNTADPEGSMVLCNSYKVTLRACYTG